MKFGDKILISGEILRQSKYSEDSEAPWQRSRNFKRIWTQTIYDTPKEGIFLGHTRLLDGDVDYNPECGNSFTTTKAHKGAWICVEGEVPRRTFLSHCSPLIHIITGLTVPEGY